MVGDWDEDMSLWDWERPLMCLLVPTEAHELEAEVDNEEGDSAE